MKAHWSYFGSYWPHFGSIPAQWGQGASPNTQMVVFCPFYPISTIKLSSTPVHTILFFFIMFCSFTSQSMSTVCSRIVIVRRAGLLLSQQDFEWRWSVPLFQCLTVLEFSFILFDLCLLITFFNFIMNYVPIVTFWIFTYHKIWILSIMFCFIWSYWIIYFFSMFVSVLESCELTGVCLLLPWLTKWK